MNTVTETLPKAIQNELDGLDETRTRLLGMAATVRMAEAVLEQCRVSKEDDVSISVGIYVLITLNVDHWRQVAPVLQALAQAGFRQTVEPSNGFDTHSRRWRCGDIHLRAFVPWNDKGACRRVQVGEKKIPEHTLPVYEWQCDNGENNQ